MNTTIPRLNMTNWFLFAITAMIIAKSDRPIKSAGNFGFSMFLSFECRVLNRSSGHVIYSLIDLSKLSV